VPSLLGARQTNESLSNPVIELFEIAHVYLPQGDKLPVEEMTVALTSGGDYLAVKGAIETLVATLNPAATISVRATRQDLLDADRSAELWAHVDRRELLLGYLGAVSAAGLAQFELRGPSTVAELNFSTLRQIANLVPQCGEIPTYPAVTRDVNLVVDEAIRWSDVEETVRAAAAPHGESIAFQDVYRDANRLGPGKKSLLFTLTLRWRQGTLTGEEADRIRERVVAACANAHGAQLRA
ncbi:MAG: phenylalanine--tRNA ligase subunit beta, partial [Pirellulales bacterium]